MCDRSCYEFIKRGIYRIIVGVGRQFQSFIVAQRCPSGEEPVAKWLSWLSAGRRFSGDYRRSRRGDGVENATSRGIVFATTVIHNTGRARIAGIYTVEPRVTIL
jgi:hypothetical protein